MKKLIRELYLFSKRCIKDQTGVYAAQSSFFIIISALPLIMLLVTLVQFISPLSQSDLMKAILELVPDSLSSSVLGIMDELYQRASTAVISFSAVTVLWSASKGIYGLEQGINQQGKDLAVRVNGIVINQFSAHLCSFAELSLKAGGIPEYAS